MRKIMALILSLGVVDVIIGSAEITLHASWVMSLKEKRMVVKSIIAKIQNKFNVSIAEVDEQDSLQTVVLGIAWVTGTVRQADGILEKVLSFIEVNTDAEIVNIQHELR